MKKHNEKRADIPALFLPEKKKNNKIVPHTEKRYGIIQTYLLHSPGDMEI